MAELLWAKNYRVVGTSRCLDGLRLRLAGECWDAIELFEIDLLNTEAIMALVDQVAPDEIYNFASFSTGSGMYDDPVAIGNVNGLAVARILDAVRNSRKAIRFCQASSSEMFGTARISPQNETTPFSPRSPYGAAKLFGHNLIGISRHRDAAFACSAILFNHESPRRSPDFVTRKVTRAAAAISAGNTNELILGDLGARRDWGHAADVVHAMWLMLQADHADDYVIATGEAHSVSDLCEVAFEHVGLNWKKYVRVDSGLKRVPESIQLVGDATHAKKHLGWAPSITFKKMIKEMVDADVLDLQSTSKSKGKIT